MDLLRAFGHEIAELRRNSSTTQGKINLALKNCYRQSAPLHLGNPAVMRSRKVT